MTWDGATGSGLIVSSVGRRAGDALDEPPHHIHIWRLILEHGTRRAVLGLAELRQHIAHAARLIGNRRIDCIERKIRHKSQPPEIFQMHAARRHRFIIFGVIERRHHIEYVADRNLPEHAIGKFG